MPGFRRPPLHRTLVSRIFVIIASTVFLPGCAATTDDGNEHLDILPRLTASEELRIGSVDDPELGFSRLGGMADVDRDGNVYVVELMDHQIRVYSPDGTLLRRIGGPGGGPGEFENAPTIGVVGDTVWAYDNMAGRITLFNRSGNVLSTAPVSGLRIPLVSGFGWVLPWRMREDGRFAGWLSRVSYSRNDPATGVQEGDSIPVPHVVFDAAGTVLDTIGWIASPPPRMVPPPGYDGPRYERVTVGDRQYRVPDPPTELPTWHPVSDGHVVVDVPYATSAEEGSLSVTRIGFEGDTVYHRVLRYRPEPFTAEELDSAAVRGAIGVFMVGGPAPGPPPRDAVAAVRAAMKFPQHRLPVRYAWVGHDDGVWLRLEGPGSAPARWLIIEAAGSVRGELELPSGARPMWSGGGGLWASVPDEFDVPWLVRYSVER